MERKYSTILKLYKPQLLNQNEAALLKYSTILKLYKPQHKEGKVPVLVKYSTILKLYKPQPFRKEYERILEI